jgi:hypothetical protein
MMQSVRTDRAGLKKLVFTRVLLRLPSLGRVMACLSILGLVGVGYLCGAAVMFFQLPSSDFLRKSFTGGKAWHERGHPQDARRTSSGSSREGITVDVPGKTWDGFTLYTTVPGARATLIDMRGEVVHRWELPFRRAWPRAPHVRDPVPDERIHWFRCHLYPNGDLLAIYHAEGDTPYGYGLVKLDKDSNLLWAYPANVHHDLDVAEDGTIYTLTQKIVREAPAGLEFLPSPYLGDFLVVLSPEGQELDSIPILEAFRDSPYALMLAVIGEGRALIDVPLSGDTTPAPDYASQLLAKGDIVHTNSVKVLSQARAAKFPLFQPGQLLLSVRNLDTIAVLDRPTRRVVWAARGVWRIQHDAEFLNNGHLLLFDNSGSIKSCRVIEYDPLTQATPWAYPNENATPFSALFRGMKQRLPNGNTLIVDPYNVRIFEVTHEKELVWESFGPGGVTAVTGARRYRPDELTFLKGARARP